jgi:Domain of unknown function (DUF1929)
MKSERRRNRRQPWLAGAVGAAVLAANAPFAVGLVATEIHQWVINQQGYKRQYGHWQTLNFASADRVNAVHVALLNTGKVLLVAGSGNDPQAFSRETFRTLLWDPRTNHAQLVPTPSDVFCGGHAFLASGRLLIAGGTQRYEVLGRNVVRAGGPMTLTNSSRVAATLPGGTRFTAPDGHLYVSNVAVTVPPGIRSRIRRGRRATITRVRPGVAQVWTDASGRGRIEIAGLRYSIHGAPPGVSATGGRIDFSKQLFQGSNLAFEFDPLAERYDAVQPMVHKRWYPTLTGLANGDVIAVSGLDGTGTISDGHTEIFDPARRSWSAGRVRYFPTYPALFLTASKKLFFSAANSGFGPSTWGRQPGIWDSASNRFTPVGGLTDPGANETAATVLLPPAQAQRFMILGGGGVGESTHLTARTAIADLRKPVPSYSPGPNLPGPTRYPLAVILPDDTVFVTGGSGQYRGEHASDNHDAEIYDPQRNRFQQVASPEIGRDYHSEALLLPDGRVATFGSNPLYADAADSISGRFEQRIEIYSPPYLFRGPRPAIESGPRVLKRGGTASFTVTQTGKIAKLRLIHPGAYTHVTDVAQRSIELPFSAGGGRLNVTVPTSPGLVPSGWYMVFADNRRGVPSVAWWVKVM